MIEAVNSTIQAASLLRASAEQTSTATSLSANPEKVQQVAQAPWISPYITEKGGDVVTLVRNSSTGAVISQIPSQTNLEARTQSPVKDAERDQAPNPVQADQASATASASPSVSTTSTQTRQAATTQQVTAFANASRAGNTNAGTVSLFA